LKSIKLKLISAVTILLILFIVTLLLANSFFLESYYIYQTRGSFEKTFETVLEAKNERTEDLLTLIRELNSENGYKYLLVNHDYQIRLSSTPEFTMNNKSELPKFQREYLHENRQELDKGNILYEALHHPIKEQSIIQLIAKFKKNQYLLITQPLQQLSDNAQIANHFFLIIGGILLILSILAVFFISRSMVRPIINITGIAKKIADLDFSHKYTGKSKDEVGMLGESINSISEKLDSTINHLKETNEQLQEEMQLQKRFLASVSHEFKTPVGLIRGYSESLNLGMIKTAKEQREISDIIIKESDRLNRLVNDIILLMRMDSGAFQINRHLINLAPVLKETVEYFSQSAKEKQIAILSDIPPSLPAMGDKERIMQILENLLSNSLHHANENGEIHLKAMKENDTIRIEVMNTGPQIPDSHIAHIFEPFYRAEDSRSRMKGGSGLGLSIVKGIALAHQGKYGVKNTETGVMFWFSIPSSKKSE